MVRERRQQLEARWLALSYVVRPVAVSWTSLIPGSLLFGCGFQAFAVAVTVYFAPRAARASTLYGSLGGGPDRPGVAVPARPPGRGRRGAQRRPVGAPPPRHPARPPGHLVAGRG